MHQLISRIQCIASEKDGSFEQQVNECKHKLLETTHNEDCKALKLTAFYNCINDKDFKKIYHILRNAFCSTNLTIPFTLVSQAPIKANQLVLEVWFAESALDYKTAGIDNVVTGELVIGASKYLFLSLNQFTESTFEQNTKDAFSSIKRVFEKLNYSAADIVRQWNYIENISAIGDSNGVGVQNYQIFNDLRSLFYSSDIFSNGYPAATGIGMKTGGLAVELIAVKSNSDLEIVPVTNSLQTNAFSYTTSVLADSSLPGIQTKTTPKFERAKCLLNSQYGLIFVSGTASISGEKTVYENDTAAQTHFTFKAIDHLLSNSNPDFAKLGASTTGNILNYRVYVRNHSDLQLVEKLCKVHFGKNPYLVVCADICRNNLLVEIEANYTFKKKI
jgi:enamine deaminase RidA (YjgF/YER057c/UK114 family)